MVFQLYKQRVYVVAENDDVAFDVITLTDVLECATYGGAHQRPAPLSALNDVTPRTNTRLPSSSREECHRMGKFVTKESFLSSNTDRVIGEMRRSKMDWCITHDDDASSG